MIINLHFGNLHYYDYLMAPLFILGFSLRVKSNSIYKKAWSTKNNDEANNKQA